MTRLFPSIVAVLFAAFTLSIQPSAQADTFGTSGNEFTIEFVNIGNAGNAADTTGYGAVPYEYRMGKYEISQDAITKATASGMANVTAGPWTGNQPAATIDWYAAAAFVNFLNTSSGKTAAYDLAWNGSAWSMNLWSSADAWQLGGENLYRNKNAFYFLPSENEWYKAAYFNPSGSSFFDFPTGSDIAPTPVTSGTNSGTAVYRLENFLGPAGVSDAGGLSPYGTMGQGGNVWECIETAADGTNSSPSEQRVVRGGAWLNTEDWLYAWQVSRELNPIAEVNSVGFRVASVPEPSTYALLLMTAAGALWFTRKRRPAKVRALIPVVAVLFTAFTLISNLQAQPLVSIETVPIGDAGNAADTTGYGAVAYEFNIGTYEVTIEQYSTFLNSVASVTSDSYVVNLWNTNMATDLNVAGISRSGSGIEGNPYSYSGLGSVNRPIAYVNWFSAARFANWMNNGATNGASTETGAYTLNGATTGVISKNAGAAWWMPSKDEWYKAAYYKAGDTNAGYWADPTQSDTAPGNIVGGATNQANYNNGVFSVTQSSSYSASQNYLTDVGSFSNSPSAYGTFDQAGNLVEWIDEAVGDDQGVIGGGWAYASGNLLSTAPAYSEVTSVDSQFTGFRVASVPEPSTYALLLMTAAGALWFTRKRRLIKVRALIPVVAALFVAFAAPSLHAQLIEARAYWRGGGSVPGFLDGGGVAFDADGNLFRTQINQDLTVREGLILKITPDGAYTSIPFPYFQPYTLALTDTGNIYVGSWFNEVAKIAPDGSVTRMYTQGSAMGMAADAKGNVWVGSVGRIHRISPNDQVEVFGTFFGDHANGMAIDESGWLIFQTASSYGRGAYTALPDLAITPTTTITGTDYLGNQTGFTFSGSVSPHLVSVVPNANSGDVGQRAFYTVPEPSTYALLLMTGAGALWFTSKRRPIKVRALIPVVAVLFAAFTLISNLQAQPLVTIDTVTVGDAGNAPDSTGYGAVTQDFRIGKYEVNVSLYTAFLNAVDPQGTNPNMIWNSGMGTNARGGITFTSGNAISSKYTAKGNMGDKPVNFVSWWDAARFANWLHNGALSYATTDSRANAPQNTGAYTLGTFTIGLAPAANPGARFWIPTENQWYKAAYYKGGISSAGYWSYATQSDTTPTPVTADSNGIGSAGGEGNSANFAQAADWNSQDGNVTTVGSSGGPSVYGAFDMDGNVREWNSLTGEARTLMGVRGGDWWGGDFYMRSTNRWSDFDTALESTGIGFRLATVPEPSTFALLAMSAAGALWMARRRR